MHVAELKPTERLEAEICELAGNIAAATARLVLLIAEYDRRQGWAECGCSPACIGCRGSVRSARTRREKSCASATRSTTCPSCEGLSSAASCPIRRSEPSLASPAHTTKRAWSASPALPPRSNSNGWSRRLTAAHKTRDQGFAAAQLDRRHFTPGTDYDNAMFIADLRLPADDGRLLTKALHAAANQLRDERGSEGPPQSREQLHADALMLLAQSYLANGPASRNGGDDYRAVIHADADLVEPPVEETSDTSTDAPRCHLERGQMITQATIERIWCDTAASRVVVRNGKLEIDTDHLQTISGSMRRALRLRDKHCSFPGCSSDRADAHHIRWRSKGGPTTLDNLILLCRFHHRLVHEYGYQVCRGPDGEIRFYDVQGRQLHNRSALVDRETPRDLSLVNAEHGVDRSDDNLTAMVRRPPQPRLRRLHPATTRTSPRRRRHAARTSPRRRRHAARTSPRRRRHAARTSPRRRTKTTA